MARARYCFVVARHDSASQDFGNSAIFRDCMLAANDRCRSFDGTTLCQGGLIVPIGEEPLARLMRLGQKAASRPVGHALPSPLAIAAVDEHLPTFLGNIVVNTLHECTADTHRLFVEGIVGFVQQGRDDWLDENQRSNQLRMTDSKPNGRTSTIGVPNDMDRLLAKSIDDRGRQIGLQVMGERSLNGPWVCVSKSNQVRSYKNVLLKKALCDIRPLCA